MNPVTDSTTIECAICGCIEGITPTYEISRVGSSVGFLNPRQRTRGSILVAPLRHVSPVTEMSDAEIMDALLLVQRIGRVLYRTFHPEGLHIWCRLSSETPARFAHQHFQIVPRYRDEPYSFAKSWELPLTPDITLSEIFSILQESIKPDSATSPVANILHSIEACKRCQSPSAIEGTVVYGGANGITAIRGDRDTLIDSVVAFPVRHAESIFDLSTHEIGALSSMIRTEALALSQKFGNKGLGIALDAGEIDGHKIRHMEVTLTPRNL